MVQRNLTTKDDLKKAVKNLATKDELKAEVSSLRMELKADIKNLKEDLETKINHLPTKDEFYASQDKLMKELEIMREENMISNDMKRKVDDHEERLEVVEEKLKISVLAA